MNNNDTEPKVEPILEMNKSMSIEEEESKEKSEEKDENDKSSNTSYLHDFSHNSSKFLSNSTQMINFFNSYAMFINDASNIILDLDVVLAKLVDAITKLKPPEKSSPHINELWSSLLDINKKSIEELSDTLIKMPDQKMYETVQDLEKLNIKLMIEYNMEVKRGKQLKIINNDE